MIINGLDGQVLVSPETAAQMVGLIRWAQEQAGSAGRPVWAQSKAITAIGDEIDRIGQRRIAQALQIAEQLDSVDASMNEAPQN